jgi:hypothetical protein
MVAGSLNGLRSRVWNLFFSLLVGGVVFGASQLPAVGADSVWGCLLFASSEQAPSQIPARLDPYSERLEGILGSKSVRELGEGSVVGEPGKPINLPLKGGFRMELTSLEHVSSQPYVLNLVLYRGEHQFLETQAKLSRGTPLFIRGPAWRDGHLVLVLIVNS